MKYPHRLTPLYITTVCVSFCIFTSGLGILSGLAIVAAKTNPEYSIWTILCYLAMIVVVFLCVLDLNHSSKIDDRQLVVQRGMSFRKILFADITSIDLVFPSKNRVSTNSLKINVHFITKKGVETAKVRPLDPFAFLFDLAKSMGNEVPVNFVSTNIATGVEENATIIKVRSFDLFENLRIEQTSIDIVETSAMVVLVSSTRLPRKNKALTNIEFFDKKDMVIEVDSEISSFSYSSRFAEIKYISKDQKLTIGELIIKTKDFSCQLDFKRSATFVSMNEESSAYVMRDSTLSLGCVAGGKLSYSNQEIQVKEGTNSISSCFVASSFSRHYKHLSILGFSADESIYFETALNNSAKARNYYRVSNDVFVLPHLVFAARLNKEWTIRSEDGKVNLVFIPEVGQVINNPKKLCLHGYYSYGSLSGNLSIDNKNKNVRIEKVLIKYIDMKTWSKK